MITVDESYIENYSEYSMSSELMRAISQPPEVSADFLPLVSFSGESRILESKMGSDLRVFFLQAFLDFHFYFLSFSVLNKSSRFVHQFC